MDGRGVDGDGSDGLAPVPVTGSGSESAFDPVAFLDRVVRTPSHDADGVDAMRSLLIETLADAGVDARVDAAGNVRASKGGHDDADGDGDGVHLALNTHLDTVTPHVPYERDADAGVIRGRGACDAKGPLAALLAAFLATDPDEGRVTLAVTPDEETLSTGAAALVGLPGGAADVDPLDPDGWIVGEPTGLGVCTAAKGRFEGTVELSGTNAHAADPDAGDNAVAGAEAALTAIRAFDADRDPHPQLGAPTLTPTRIEGGGATNQVPADCRITVDRRSVPPETAEGFAADLTERLRAAVPAGVEAAFAFTERETPFLEAFATDADDPLVGAVADAARRRAADAAGVDRPDAGAVGAFGAATEASYFAPAPTVVFGPGDLADAEGAVAHADREYVRVGEVAVAAAALADAVDALVG